MPRKSGMWCLAAQHCAQGSLTRTVPAASSQASHSTQGTMLTQPSPGSAFSSLGDAGLMEGSRPTLLETNILQLCLGKAQNRAAC